MARENVISDETDYSDYITCALTPTMEEYMEWLAEFVPYKKFDARSAFLGVRLYSYFQASETHQAALEARRKAREAEDEPEPEPAKPARRGRKPLAAVPDPEPEPPVKPARRGRKPAAAAPEPEPEEEAPKPRSSRRRGSRASAESAPY